MNRTEIIKNASRTFNKMSLKFKKHSPEVLVVAGVVGVVTSAVMACKATTKLSSILDDSKKEIDEIHYCADHPEKLPEEYTVEDSKKDLTIVYSQTCLRLVKLYAPAVILGALSLSAIIASNNILRKRNVALGAAYTAIDKSFKGYRSRVIERFGETVDKELKYNIKAKEIEETVVDKNGEEKIVKKTVNVAYPEHSEYARFFDERCAGWEKDAELNLMFLRRQQDYANEKLRARGYLFLNEVYEMLGIQKTQAGQIVGWIYDEENPIGDNMVDFGIYDLYNEKKRDFVNGYERSILLDFNVDGNILDML